jgi:hypothetical protein
MFPDGGGICIASPQLGPGKTTVLVMRIGSNGQLLWSKQLETAHPNETCIPAFITTINEDTVALAVNHSYLDDFGYRIEPAVVVLAADGSIQWQRKLQGGSLFTPREIQGLAGVSSNSLVGCAISPEGGQYIFELEAGAIAQSYAYTGPPVGGSVAFDGYIAHFQTLEGVVRMDNDGNLTGSLLPGASMNLLGTRWDNFFIVGGNPTGICRVDSYLRVQGGLTAVPVDFRSSDTPVTLVDEEINQLGPTQLVDSEDGALVVSLPFG